jgi:hypothetical protein
VGEACGTHGKAENVYKVFVEKPEGKRLLGRPRCRSEEGFRMDFMGIGWGGGWNEFSWLGIETRDVIL